MCLPGTYTCGSGLCAPLCPLAGVGGICKCDATHTCQPVGVPCKPPPHPPAPPTECHDGEVGCGDGTCAPLCPSTGASGGPCKCDLTNTCLPAGVPCHPTPPALGSSCSVANPCGGPACSTNPPCLVGQTASCSEGSPSSCESHQCLCLNTPEPGTPGAQCSVQIAAGCGTSNCAVTCVVGQTAYCSEGNGPPYCGENHECLCMNKPEAGTAGAHCSVQIAPGCGTANCAVTCAIGQTALCTQGNGPPYCGENFSCQCTNEPQAGAPAEHCGPTQIASGCGFSNCAVVCPVGKTANCSAGNPPPLCGEGFNCACQ